MNKNKLFPQINGILHGGDYNAEQWLDRPDILAKDIEMMKEAGNDGHMYSRYARST